MIWIHHPEAGLCAKRVPPNLVVYHHFPHEIGHLVVYPIFRQPQMDDTWWILPVAGGLTSSGAVRNGCSPTSAQQWRDAVATRFIQTLEVEGEDGADPTLVDGAANRSIWNQKQYGTASQLVTKTMPVEGWPNLDIFCSCGHEFQEETQVFCTWWAGHVDHYEKKSAAYAVKYGRVRFAMLFRGGIEDYARSPQLVWWIDSKLGTPSHGFSSFSHIFPFQDFKRPWNWCGAGTTILPSAAWNWRVWLRRWASLRNRQGSHCQSHQGIPSEWLQSIKSCWSVWRWYPSHPLRPELALQVELAEKNDEYLVLVMHDATDHFGYQHWFNQVGGPTLPVGMPHGYSRAFKTLRPFN